MAFPTSPATGVRPSGAQPGSAGASVWSDKAVETLKTLWADGELSAAIIARRLGVSRNAVLGKVHRLGLSKRRPGSRRPAPPRAPRTPRPPKGRRDPAGPRAPRSAPSDTPGFPEAFVDPGPGLVARLEDMPAHGCHWPIGDPLRPGFRFCGRPARRDPYCDAHRIAAYRPGGPKPLEGLLARVGLA